MIKTSELFIVSTYVLTKYLQLTSMIRKYLDFSVTTIATKTKISTKQYQSYRVTIHNWTKTHATDALANKIETLKTNRFDHKRTFSTIKPHH